MSVTRRLKEMKLTEGKALALVFLGIAIAFVGAYAVLTSLGAGNGAIVLMALVLMIAGTQVLEAIVHHYSAERRKQQR